MKLLILSDIHAGSKAKCRDLNPDTETHKDCAHSNITESLIATIIKDGNEVDAIVIPGDISNSGEPDEFISASTAINKILFSEACLKGDTHSLVFTTGNHDVCWDIMKRKLDKSKFWKSKRYIGLEEPSHIFSSALLKFGHHAPTSPYNAKRVHVWDSPRIKFICYNSAIDDGPESDVHHGKYNPSDEGEIKAACSGGDDKYRVFLTHHHPLQYRDPDPHDPDFSLMQNADDLMGLLHQLNFDLYIHGHKHAPNFRTHKVGDHRIEIIGSGSFSAKLPPQWEGTVLNCAHIIELTSRNQGMGSSGTIKTFAHTGMNLWIPSSDSICRTPHIRPFGEMSDPGHYIRYFSDRFKNDQSLYNLDVVFAGTVFCYLEHDAKLHVLTEISRIHSLSALVTPTNPDGWPNVHLQKSST